jgi:peptidoglycan/LPS O-acetylase OafA/YrhL
MGLITGFFKIFQLNPNYENRVFGLDLMRAIAIISVVVGHGRFILEKASTNFPWIPLVDGVELFFVLSGFLIGGILLKIFHNTQTLKLKTISDFWIRRWFRTIPNYILVLILNIVVVYYGVINEDFSQFNWRFFLFLQNFSTPFIAFFWESWSLSIEEWFYLFFPIIIGISYLILNFLKVKKRIIFLIAICIFLIVPLSLRIFIASKFQVDDFWLGVKIYKVVIYRLDSIAFGLLGAYIYYWYPKTWYKSRNIAFVLGLIILYVILFTTFNPNAFITKVFQMLFQSVGCFLLLPKFESIKKAPRVIVKTVTHISLISYSMYLINLALVAEVIGKNFPPDGKISAYYTYFIYWFLVIFISTVMYKFYERPLTNLRDRWKN